MISAGAAGLLAEAGSAAVGPSSNGTIVMSKCEDAPNCDVSHIWTIDPGTGAEHQVTTGAAYWDDDPAVSPDGRRVAFQHCPIAGGTCRIAVVEIGGGTVTNLTAGTNYEDYPAFSPDGSKLVFSRDDPAGGVHLIVMDATGGNEHPLTSGADGDSAAAWSPDGTTIAFTRFVTGAGARIYEVPATGGPPAPLTAGPEDSFPSFSPDGSRIVFAGGGAIQVMDSSGANRHVLTAPAAGLTDDEPAFAPDGTKIVFIEWTLATPRTSPLIVMNADGSNQHTIGGASELLYRPDWQPTDPAPPAATVPAPTPAAARAADVGAPRVRLGAPSRESVRKARLHLFATSDEAATGIARGKVAIRALGKRYRLRPTAKTLEANTRTKVGLRIPRKSLRAIRAALARHEKLKARIVVTVADRAGNVTTKARAIRLRR